MSDVLCCIAIEAALRGANETRAAMAALGTPGSCGYAVPLCIGDVWRRSYPARVNNLALLSPEAPATQTVAEWEARMRELRSRPGAMAALWASDARWRRALTAWEDGR